MDSIILKVKDSVDLFLSDETYIMAYFMNTRQRKTFKVNKELIALLEMIDGKKSLNDIYKLMNDHYGIDSNSVDSVVNAMIENRIITVVNKNNYILPQEDVKRYDRQINYFTEFLDSEEAGLTAQKKLMDSNILVFGCGAIGGNISLELVMAGVQNITLYDYDVVEVSDVSRHMYFTNEDVGTRKIDALKRQLKLINNKVNVTCIYQSMKPNTDICDLVRKHDFVINTLDEPYIGYTSSKISRICIKYNIPHFVGGGFDAHLASTGEIIIPFITPCVECYSTHFKEKLKEWKPKKHPVKTRYREIGGLASMSLFSASFAAIEIIKYLAGLTEIKKSFKVRGELLFTDMSLTYLEVSKNPNCPICGGKYK